MLRGSSPPNPRVPGGGRSRRAVLAAALAAAIGAAALAGCVTQSVQNEVDDTVPARGVLEATIAPFQVSTTSTTSACGKVSETARARAELLRRRDLELQQQAADLSDRRGTAILVHSPDAAQLSRQYQAVLHELSKVQVEILRADAGGLFSSSVCAEPTSTSVAAAP